MAAGTTMLTTLGSICRHY